MKFPLSHKILALVLIPLMMSLSIMTVLAVLLKQAESGAIREAHSSEVRAETSLIYGYGDLAAKALTYYVNFKSPLYLEAASDSIAQMKKELPTLKQLIETNPSQSSALAVVDAAYKRLTSAESAAKQSLSELAAELPEVWSAVAQMSVEFKNTSMYESRATSGSLAQDELKRQQYKRVLLGGAVVNILLAFVLVWFAARPLARRLRILEVNNTRLANRLPLMPPEDGNDEISELDQSFRSMAHSLNEYLRKEEATIENVNDIICSLDRQQRFIRINQAGSDILGYKQFEIQGKQLSEFLAPAKANELIARVDKTIQNRASDRFESVMLKSNGVQVGLEWTVHWSDVDEALFCVVHDITELKRLERMKQEFLAMVSHDLRSPLTALQSTFELMEDGIYGELAPDGKKAVLSTERNIACLIGLINEILDIEKIESGKFELEKRMTRLQPIFERICELVDDLAEKRNVALTVKQTYLRGFVDGDRIQQVMLNLLSHVAKNASPGDTLSMDTEYLSEEDMIKLSIKTEKPFPADAMKDSIFDRFQQSTDVEARTRGGLGLALSKALVVAHGGSIGVSESNGPAHFWCNIPASPRTKPTGSQTKPR